MENEKSPSTHHPHRRDRMRGNGVSNGVYGLGFIGAAVYFVQHATTFWGGVLGLVKAVFWPALLIYKVLENLKM
jgi:hypothetical protein